MQYTVYQDADGFWRWQLIASNGLIAAVSSERYTSKNDCFNAIDLVKKSADAPIHVRA